MDTSKYNRKLVSICKKVFISFVKVTPEQISFNKGALSLSPSSKELIVQLLKFKNSRDEIFVNFVTLVQARLRKLNLGNW